MRIYKREKYLKKIRPFYNSDIIKVITGIRRCGKSCIMRLIIDELKENGISENQIIYLPLDKRGFKTINTPEELEARIEEMIVEGEDFYYLFIDEIQNVKGFEKIVQGFQEEENFSIFLTGSNSYLLSDEISTKLTGRYLNFEIYTLDFKEYLQMKQFYGLEIDSNLNKELDEFIINGGFPKSLEFADKASRNFYTKSILEEIFEKDIRKRKIVRNRVAFEAVQSYVINNYASTFSLDNIVEYFKNVVKVDVSKNTLKNYIDILLKAKIIYKCERFDQKSKRSLSREYKFYVADLSLFFALNTDNRFNYGPSFENLIYLYLISNGYSASVGKIGNLECDFITRDIENNYAYIQVSQTIASEETELREYRPFTKIRDGYPRYLITADTFKNKKDGIHHLNIIDVLLENEKI